MACSDDGILFFPPRLWYAFSSFLRTGHFSPHAVSLYEFTFLNFWRVILLFLALWLSRKTCSLRCGFFLPPAHYSLLSTKARPLQVPCLDANPMHPAKAPWGVRHSLHELHATFILPHDSNKFSLKFFFFFKETPYQWSSCSCISPLKMRYISPVLKVRTGSRSDISKQ